jgi:hypothetical protein
MHCDCQGRAHVVCRPILPPITLTPCQCGERRTKHFHHVSLHSTPVRPKTWDCGCRGAAHPVCDPTWKRVKDAPAAAKPIRFPTLKQAIKDGLTVRPHGEHVWGMSVQSRGRRRDDAAQASLSLWRGEDDRARSHCARTRDGGKRSLA